MLVELGEGLSVSTVASGRESLHLSDLLFDSVHTKQIVFVSETSRLRRRFGQVGRRSASAVSSQALLELHLTERRSCAVVRDDERSEEEDPGDDDGDAADGRRTVYRHYTRGVVAEVWAEPGDAVCIYSGGVDSCYLYHPG